MKRGKQRTERFRAGCYTSTPAQNVGLFPESAPTGQAATLAPADVRKSGCGNRSLIPEHPHPPEAVRKWGSIFTPIRSDKGTSCRSENAEATRTTRITPHPSPLPPCSRGRGYGSGGILPAKSPFGAPNKGGWCIPLSKTMQGKPFFFFRTPSGVIPNLPPNRQNLTHESVGFGIGFQRVKVVPVSGWIEAQV